MELLNTKTLLESVYQESLKSFKNLKTILKPFAVFAIFELIILVIIYFIPRDPLRDILGPLIRLIWGERFLHFPENFLLYPELLSHSKMVLIVFIGSLLTGTAVSLIISIHNNEKIEIGVVVKATIRRYFNLVAVMFIFSAIFYVLTKVIPMGLIRYFQAGHQAFLFIPVEIWLGSLLLVINFFLAIFARSAFIYTIPIIMTESLSPLKSIKKSLILFKNLFIPTIILVGLAMLIYIPKIILDINSAYLMDKFFPEIVVFVSVFGIILSSLVIDTLIIITTTSLYLTQREKR